MHAAPTTDMPQRSRGLARVALAGAGTGAGGATRLAGLRQQGSAKVFVLPDPVHGPEIVFLNTSGGLTGGDGLELALTLAPGARATATTQTAERVYRSPDSSPAGKARIELRMDLGAGAHLDWLPQETILFDGGAAVRRTTITLATGASCLMAETLILGRAAMGETLARIAFSDHRLIRRADSKAMTPLHMEAFALDPARLGANPAGLAGARALASVVMVTPGAADALGPVRAELSEPGVRAAASAPDGRLVVRLMADDGWPLRRQLSRLIRLLRRAPNPRVWQD